MTNGDDDAFPVLRGHVADPHPKRRHHEGYCLMLYANPKGDVEWLWNSRDGVTPFTIDSLRHCQWDMDVYCPFFVPPIGMRVFVDLTRDKAFTYCERKVLRYWDHPTVKMCEHPSLGPLGRAGAAQALADEMMKDRGQPDIVTVDGPLRCHFENRARALSLFVP